MQVKTETPTESVDRKLHPQQKRMWAKENKEFSKRVNGGVWAPDGTFVELPYGISRLTKGNSYRSFGWVVKKQNNNKEISLRFKDDCCGHCWRSSLAEATLALEKFMKETSVKPKPGPKKKTEADPPCLGKIEGRLSDRIKPMDILMGSLFSRTG